MKIGSLCTGYGGLDMAVEAFFGAETIWTCEFDKYASQVIEKRINKPNHGDLKTTDWTKVEPINILTAGYPCQPFSHAGSRKGADDERHLWPYIKEIIGILRPQFVVLENVRGHFGLGFGEVIGDLATIGYDATWRLVRASDVGAPHRRERLFVLAHSNGARCHNAGTKLSNGSKQSDDIVVDANSEHWRVSSSHTDNAISNTHNERRFGSMSRLSKRYDSRGAMHLLKVPAPLDQGKLNAKFVEYMMGLPNGWVTDVGLSRSQQLKILGNGVVPQQAEYALELLWETYVNQ